MESFSPTSVERSPCGVIGFSSILRLIIGLVLAAGIVSADAQVPQIPSVSQEELASHLMTYVPPIYPATAQSAQVQADVVINVEISPDGFVQSTKVLTGPPMLSRAGVSAVKQWRYSPFHSGNGLNAVTGNVLVSFTLTDKPPVQTPHESSANGSYSTSIMLQPPDHRGEPDAEVANRFDIPWQTCTRGVISHTSDWRTADACKQAAAIADEFSPSQRSIDRRRAYVCAARAYGNVRDLQTAVHYADKAVEMVKLGHDDNSGSDAAYSIRGQIRAFSGDMAGGDGDLSVAEDFCRKGELYDALKRDLQFHAELLKRMNRSADAQAKLDEAAKL